MNALSEQSLAVHYAVSWRERFNKPNKPQQEETENRSTGDTWFDVPRPNQSEIGLSTDLPDLFDSTKNPESLSDLLTKINKSKILNQPPRVGGAAAEWDLDTAVREADSGLDVTRRYAPGRHPAQPELDNDNDPESWHDQTRRTSPAQHLKNLLPRSATKKRERISEDTFFSETPTQPHIPNAEDRYKLGDEIGRGGMGRILCATDQALGREVAIKVLHKGLASPGEVIKRFLKEAQIAGKLEHPSIIPIHDVGQLPSGELFYAMKRLHGQSLEDIIKKLAQK